MKNAQVKFRRAKETSFLIVDSIIFDKFSPYALKVYGQLRKLVSYTQELSETEITVKALASLSGISERKCYDVLNELENEHYIIKRTNWDNFRYGKTNLFEVSQTYGYFKNEQIAQELHTPAQYADPEKTPVQILDTPAPCADPSAQYADLITKDTQEVFQEKLTNCESSSKFIFSESTDKNLLAQKLDRDSRSDDEFLNDCLNHVENHSDKKFPKSQRANALVKLLKKLKSDNVIFIVNDKTQEQKTETRKETEQEKNERLWKEREAERRKIFPDEYNEDGTRKKKYL